MSTKPFRRLFREIFLINVRKTGSYGYAYDFSVDYRATAVDEILYIHNYLMEKKQYKSVCSSNVFIAGM